MYRGGRCACGCCWASSSASTAAERGWERRVRAGLGSLARLSLRDEADGGGMLEVCSGRQCRWRARFGVHEGLQLGAAAAATAPPAELFNAAAGAYLDDDDERVSAKGKTGVEYIILDRVPSAASSGGACWTSSRRPWTGGAFR